LLDGCESIVGALLALDGSKTDPSLIRENK